mmetsp:Transcript_5283/g.12641  ORF Transcript_5283/g.12641 Transcript_5283/m.12641 type:complete len:718 (-) Transcript_5283:123-2276(-)
MPRKGNDDERRSLSLLVEDQSTHSNDQESEDDDCEGQEEHGSSSESEMLAPARLGLQRAGFLIYQAAEGIQRAPIRGTKKARRIFVAHLYLLPLVRVTTWCLVVLTFFEKPLWCRKQPELCGDPKYPSSITASWFVPHCWDLALEALFLLPIGIDVCFRQYCHGNHMHYIVAVLANVLESVMHFAVPEHSFRVAPYFRIFLAAMYSRAVGSRLALVIRTLPSILATFVFSLLFVTFSAWIGVVLMPPGTPEGQKFFHGLGDGMWTLTVLLTTANFPDAMMPAYRDSRCYFIYFGIFIAAGIYFLINVVTAVTFNVYQDCQDSDHKWLVQFRLECTQAAFRELCAENSVDEEEVTEAQIKELFKELNNYDDIEHITDSMADHLFDMMDHDKDGGVSQEEFSQVIQFLVTAIEVEEPPPILARRCPACWASPPMQLLREAVEKGWLENVMDVVAVILFVSTVCTTWSEIWGEAPTSSPKVSSKSFVGPLFGIELCLHLMVLGWPKYWKNARRKFDFVVTMLALFACAIVWLPTAYNDARLIRVIAAVRVLRVMRILNRFPTFSVIMHTFTKTLPQSVIMAQVMFCAMVIFCILGVQLFGGVINQDPDSPTYSSVASSDFGAANYYANNFNDMLSGMVVLFELLVVNNWFVITDGFSAAVGPFARIYFVAWYMIGVLICLNIVVAFVVDTFVSEFKAKTAKDEPIRLSQYNKQATLSAFC